MHTVQILGPGCQRCQQLADNTRAAISRLGLEVDIEKVTNLDLMVAAGVMLPPAIVIDGVVRSTGRVLTIDEIVELLD